MSIPHLEKLEQCAMITEFKPGQVVFREGEIANRFYLITQGLVEVRMNVARRGSLPIYSVTGGDVLGWSWLFPPYGAHFSAKAIEPTKAIFLYGTSLREQCDEDHDLGYALIERTALVMMQRLNALQLLLFSRHSVGSDGDDAL